MFPAHYDAGISEPSVHPAAVCAQSCRIMDGGARWDLPVLTYWCTTRSFERCGRASADHNFLSLQPVADMEEFHFLQYKLLVVSLKLDRDRWRRGSGGEAPAGDSSTRQPHDKGRSRNAKSGVAVRGRAGPGTCSQSTRHGVVGALTGPPGPRPKPAPQPIAIKLTRHN